MKTAALHRLVRCARLEWQLLSQPWGGGSGGLGYMYVHENSVHVGVQTTVMSASFTQRQLCVCSTQGEPDAHHLFQYGPEAEDISFRQELAQFLTKQYQDPVRL